MSKIFDVSWTIAMAIDVVPHVLRHEVSASADPEPRLVMYTVGDLTPADVDNHKCRMINICGHLKWGMRFSIDIWFEKKGSEWWPTHADVLKDSNWSGRKTLRFAPSDHQPSSDWIVLPKPLRTPR